MQKTPKAERFVIELSLGNDAMRTYSHVARALRAVADRVKLQADSGKIMDENGNTVGFFMFE